MADNGDNSPAMKIETVQISDLNPAQYNPRIMSPDEINKLKRSIEEFGFVEPVVVNKDNTIIGGHQRIKAATELGITEVPIVRKDLSDGKAKALNLALNKIHGDWDYTKLPELLAELSNMDDIDIELTGFDLGEIEGLDTMPGLPSGEKEPFEQMSFILTNEQAADIKAALEVAKKAGAFVETGNENSNGNALARIVEAYRG